MSFHTGTFQYLAKQRLMFFLWVRVIKKRQKEKKKNWETYMLIFIQTQRNTVRCEMACLLF